MTELTGKQNRRLRSLGQKIEATCTVGKAGLSEGLTGQILSIFDARELIKIRLPAGSAKDRQQMGDQLASSTDAHCVSVLGRTALLYRPNPNLPADKQISLD